MWPKPEPPAERPATRPVLIRENLTRLLIRSIRAIALNGQNRRSDLSFTDSSSANSRSSQLPAIG
jgi:hypothetical protein